MTYAEFEALKVTDRISLRTKGTVKTGEIVARDSAIYVMWDDGSPNGMLYPPSAKDVERI
jgi:hypothetical protein